MASTRRHVALRSVGPVLVAGLLVVVGVASLGAQLFQSRTADPADWESAAQAAVEVAEPTDGIRVHPAWSETALPHLRPVGNLLHRQHFPLLEDFTGLERVLILSERERLGEALQRLPFNAEPASLHRFNSVALAVVDIPEPLRIDDDLSAHLSTAQIYYRDDDGEQTRCRRTARSGRGEWRCDGSRNAGKVRPLHLEVEHEPRRCIQAFPPSGGRTLVIDLTVESTKDVLRLRAGLDNRAARLPSGDDVRYRIFVNGEPIANERVDAHRSTWRAHDILTFEYGGDAIDLRIEVESVDPDPHHRRFCFNGWTLSPEQVQSSKR